VKGDTVYLLKKIDDSWMSGECNGRTGLFPTNYVKVLLKLFEYVALMYTLVLRDFLLVAKLRLYISQIFSTPSW